MRTALILGTLIAASAIAHADDALMPTVDKPEALRLFEEGRAALEAGNADEACKKFDQSLKKDPRAVGTLLNLGLCNERQGKVASALALFIEAYDRATEQESAEQRKAAEEHITTLRPQVPFLVLRREGQPIAGEKLVIDDKVVALDEKEVPVDPGGHLVTLTAPGRLPFETQVSAKVGERLKLKLPELQVPKPGVVRDSWRRSYGRVMTFGGGGLVVLGVTGMWLAKHRYDLQFEDPDGAGPRVAHCGDRPTAGGLDVCDREGKSKVDSARTIGVASSVVAGIGLVTLAAGVYLWWSAPEQVVVTPVASNDSAGVSISGRF